MNQYTLPSNFLDRKRTLIIAPDHIAYENKDTVGDTFTTLLQQDVTGLKYHMDEIVWYRFHVGKKFSIALKDRDNKELHVTIKNYFGLHKGFDQLCEDIVADLQNNFLTPITDRYLKLFSNSIAFTLGSITFDSSGMKTSSLSLSWHEVAIREYYSYFVLYKIGNPELYHRVGFDEWEAEAALSVARGILKEKEST